MDAELLRDTLARVIRLREAIEDGDMEFVTLVVSDLIDDLERALP